MVKSFHYNRTVREALASRPKIAGEVGIEIECEGSKLPPAPLINGYWTTHVDGSLRGESCEYVLATPVPRKDILPALEVLEQAFKECKTKLKDSYRTSVHIHVNMQTVSVKQTYNTILLYGILEDILTEYAGPTRTGNLFCLRMSDAEYMIEALREAIVHDYYADLNSNFLRYAGCNVKSLFDHNSLEFRAFRGTSDMKLIAQWSDILLQIKDAALKYENPVAIMSDFSALGPDRFIEKIFSPSIQKLIKGFNNYQNRIFDGVRMVQDVAFASDWAPTPDKNQEKKSNVKFYNVDIEANIEAIPRDPGLPDWMMLEQVPINPIDQLARIRNDERRPQRAALIRARRPLAQPVVAPEGQDVDWPGAREEEI